MTAHKNPEEHKYSLWAKIMFYPCYSLWIGWCFLLGGEIGIKFPDKEWRLK